MNKTRNKTKLFLALIAMAAVSLCADSLSASILVPDVQETEETEMSSATEQTSLPFSHLISDDSADSSLASNERGFSAVSMSSSAIGILLEDRLVDAGDCSSPLFNAHSLASPRRTPFSLLRPPQSSGRILV